MKLLISNFRFLIAGVAALLLLSTHSQAATQQVVMEAGWNLVSVQVGSNGWNVADFENGLDVSNTLQAVWGYDASVDQWTSYQPQAEGYPHDLDSVEPGHGYWVKVSQSSVLELTGEPWDGAVDMVAGWNLIGFAGLNIADLEAMELSSVFQNKLDRIAQVWTFDNGPAQQFVGYDTTSIPQINDLTAVEPGRGYWIYALEGITLSAVPEISLISDFDLSPLQAEVPFPGGDPVYNGKLVRYAGAEDTGADLNGNGIVDDLWTQDTVIFRQGVDRQTIIIRNADLGLMNWSVEENVDWLTLDTASGTVGSEKDYVSLRVDRTGMFPGTYTGEFILIKAGQETKVVDLILEVSTLAGDYKGYAATTRVNGKDIGLGKVDMALSMFMESDALDETRFRGVINRDRSLLFPRDVFMHGIFYNGNDFSLTTSFVMPEGDRNVPPFDIFTHDPSDLGGTATDKDYNTNGVLDVENPFPYAIRREITLLGKRVNPNRLEGDFIESIEGMLPDNEAIYIEGTFELERETFVPSRRSAHYRENTKVGVIGGSGGSTILEKVITIPDSITIESVKVGLGVGFPDPTVLHVSLTSPDGSEVVLHNNVDPIAGSYSPTNFNGQVAAGDWTLRIAWDPSSGERGFFNYWNLEIEGLAFHSVQGRVVYKDTDDFTMLPAEGVRIILSGSNLIEQDQTSLDGMFSFGGLSENEYTLLISSPLYEEAVSDSFRITDQNVDLGDIELKRIYIDGQGQGELHSSPKLGYAPLTVEFALIEDPFWPDIFIDHKISPLGSSDPAEVSVSYGHAEYTYTQPGIYNPKATYWGSEEQRLYTVTGDPITVLRSAPDSSSGTNLLFWSFIGSGAGTNTNLHEEAKRDMASFDIDRWPLGVTAGTEDTDIGVDGNVDGKIDANTNPERYRMICTMGGYVFGVRPAKVGGLVLQTGRVEGFSFPKRAKEE